MGATAKCAASYSLAPGRESPITHSHGGSSPVSHVSSTRGSRRARHRVCIDSAPPINATSSSLRWMRSAISLARSCGLLPPTVESAVAFGAMPKCRARSAPGSA